MSFTVGGSTPQLTFADATVQNTAFTGLNQSATPFATSLGYQALNSNTGANNTAVGYQAGYSNTTGSTLDAFGYQAGYSNTTGQYNTFLGRLAGYGNQTGSYNLFVGEGAGYTTTGASNTFIGAGAGYFVSSGAKNTILGGYSGNQGGLDIRTASNNIVLSDGDGNPQGYCSSGIWNFGLGGTTSVTSGYMILQGAAISGGGALLAGYANGTGIWYLGSYSQFAGGTNYSYLLARGGTSGGVYLSTGATSWSAYSDSRLKNVTGTYTNALNDIAQIEPVKFTWKGDPENTPQVGVIAQSVQSVVPEAVDMCRMNKEDETDYLSVRYTELIPLMIAAIQELKAEFDAYKTTHP